MSRIFYFFLLIISLLFGYVYFLYKTEKILFLTSRYNDEFNAHDRENISGYRGKRFINGLYIKDYDEKINVPLYLNDALFEVKNPEYFFHDAFFQFFRHINMYESDTYVLSLNHVAVSGKKMIINMHIDKKKDLSIVKEMNLLKSIYITAKKILPYLENIYFYDDIERLDFTHLLPYINKELVEFFFDTDSAEYSEKKIFLHNGILIPLLEKSDGHVIDDIFEKNIFQSFQAAPIFFPQHILYTPGWFKEINALTLQRDHEVAFYFLNFLQDINTRIKIFYYPFLTDEDTVALVDEIDRKVFYNREICSEIIRIKKIAEEYNIPITIEVMPLKAILYFPSYSLYIQLIGKDRKNIQHVFELLFKK